MFHRLARFWSELAWREGMTWLPGGPGHFEEQRPCHPVGGILRWARASLLPFGRGAVNVVGTPVNHLPSGSLDLEGPSPRLLCRPRSGGKHGDRGSGEEGGPGLARGDRAGALHLGLVPTARQDLLHPARR